MRQWAAPQAVRTWSQIPTMAATLQILTFLKTRPRQLLRITNGSGHSEQSGGKVSIRIARRSWSKLGQFNTSETPQTEIRNAFLHSAESDILAGGTPEPIGLTYIYIPDFIKFHDWMID